MAMNKNVSIALAVLIGMVLVDLVIGPLTAGLFNQNNGNGGGTNTGG